MLQEEEYNLYAHRDSRNYIKDGEPRALYWHSYRETFERLKYLLRLGEKIPAMVSVCLIANNLLRAEDFDLRNKDRSPIGGFSIPGISAHISFTSNKHEACGGILDRDCKRQDRLYILEEAGDLAQCNYYAYYLPTPNQPLHIRLVHQIHFEDPNIRQVPFKYRKGVAELFSRGKIR